MNDQIDQAQVADDLLTVKCGLPVLYGVLVELAEELEASYIDPDSTIAGPANALVEAVKTVQNHKH